MDQDSPSKATLTYQTIRNYDNQIKWTGPADSNQWLWPGYTSSQVQTLNSYNLTILRKKHTHFMSMRNPYFNMWVLYSQEWRHLADDSRFYPQEIILVSHHDCSSSGKGSRAKFVSRIWLSPYAEILSASKTYSASALYVQIVWTKFLGLRVTMKFIGCASNIR